MPNKRLFFSKEKAQIAPDKRMKVLIRAGKTVFKTVHDEFTWQYVHVYTCICTTQKIRLTWKLALYAMNKGLSPIPDGFF